MKTLTIAGAIGQVYDTKNINGTSLHSFSVATRDGRDKATGNWKTLWIKCNIFGKLGDSVADMLDKGVQVTAIGEFTLEEYQNRNGETVKNPVITVQSIEIQGKSNNAQNNIASKQEPTQVKPTAPAVSLRSDDVPF